MLITVICRQRDFAKCVALNLAEIRVIKQDLACWYVPYINILNHFNKPNVKYVNTLIIT